MSKMIQVRNVPERVHTTLKARAAQEGISLSDYIKRELERTVALPAMRDTVNLPTIRGWLERTRRAKPRRTGKSSAQIIRALRDAR